MADLDVPTYMDSRPRYLKMSYRDVMEDWLSPKFCFDFKPKSWRGGTVSHADDSFFLPPDLMLAESFGVPSIRSALSLTSFNFSLLSVVMI